MNTADNSLKNNIANEEIKVSLSNPISPPYSSFITPDTFRTLLNYFNFYRLAVASLFFLTALFYGDHLNIGKQYFALFSITSVIYVLVAIGFYGVLKKIHGSFNLQLGIHVITDIIVIVTFMHASGGLQSGLGIMLLISLAASALVSQGLLVMFYAAIASLAILIEQTIWVLFYGFPATSYLQAGLFSMGFFVTTGVIHQLAVRVTTNQELARKRGADLANQLQINELIIQDMQDGVLVVDEADQIRLHNLQAANLLNLPDSNSLPLAHYAPQILQELHEWRIHNTQPRQLNNVYGNKVPFRSRFVHPKQNKGGDTVIFLENMSKIQEQAKQLKLAALGRLTANIAHEIRNPLSAISHASELLEEEKPTATQQKLCRIIAENTHRLDRMVKDVLELTRRDRVHAEIIPLNIFLPNFIARFAEIEKIPLDCFHLELENSIHVHFDKSHLEQVLWNLVRNAWRHGNKKRGSIYCLVQEAKLKDQVEINIINDGPSVPKNLQSQLFEPFFTTHRSGSGLGLYIGRELCDANGAILEYIDGGKGAHFRITCNKE